MLFAPDEFHSGPVSAVWKDLQGMRSEIVSSKIRPFRNLIVKNRAIILITKEDVECAKRLHEYVGNLLQKMNTKTKLEDVVDDVLAEVSMPGILKTITKEQPSGELQKFLVIADKFIPFGTHLDRITEVTSNIIQGARMVQEICFCVKSSRKCNITLSDCLTKLSSCYKPAD